MKNVYSGITRYIVILLVFSTFGLYLGCGQREEPQGYPVQLTAKESKGPKFINESKRKWYVWHTKGMKLANQGQHQQALYCFHQAIPQWPKKVSEKEKTRLRKLRLIHRTEPTDTYLQLAFLYIKLKEPKLAIKYFKKFKKHFPYDKNADRGIAEAKAMLK